MSNTITNLNQNTNGSTGSNVFNSNNPVTILYFSKSGEIVNKLVLPLIPSSEIIDINSSVTYNYTLSNSVTLNTEYVEIHLLIIL